MSKAVILIAIGLAVGITVGAWGLGAGIPWIAGPTPPAAAPPMTAVPRAAVSLADDADPERYAMIVESLSEILEHEINERLYLEEQLLDLAEQVARLETRLGEDAGEPAPTASDANDRRRRRFTAVTEESFVEAGFSAAEAAYLKQQRDEAAMARLYLRDRAIREGWFRTDRYFDELGKLPGSLGQLREQMDETAYDRYLYAVGQPNRVAVVGVLESSAAQQAGLRPGDVIYRYDGDRLYSSNGLLSASRSGEFGDPVPVEVLRENQRLMVYLPRGPLGIRMNSFSEKP